MAARDGDPPRTFYLTSPLPNHLINHRGAGGAILCVSLRRNDIEVAVGGMYDASGDEERLKRSADAQRGMCE